MASTRSFSAMLNEYLPNRLLREELVKRDYVLNRVEKDNSWKGGDLIVPFKGAGASSISFGSLTADTDISEDEYVRGKISAYKEVWSTLKFNHTDLLQHDGRIPESTFLKILPDVVDDFLVRVKESVSQQLLDGPHFAKAAENGANDGTMVVDNIDRFVLGQKCEIDDDDSSDITAAYVRAIDVNASKVTFYDARTGGSVIDLSGMTTAQNAKIFHPGAKSNSFQSLADALLSSANGGGASLHGQTKTAYPYLQAVNVNGNDITAANILEKVFDAYNDVKKKARGQAKEVLMSFKNFANIMKKIETDRSAYKVRPDSRKATAYGWEEIDIMSVAGDRLKIVGIQECPDDKIMFMDWSAVTFRSNGLFRRRKSPDGKEYFEVRSTSGYSYLLDMCLFGELEVRKPGNCGIIHTISYA